jgi:predicted dehydrogenase
MPRNYRVAVIGRTGRGDYGHGLDAVWLRIPNAQVVAVADDNERGRAAAQQRLKARNAYADYRVMLQKERPNLVAVAPRWLDCHRDMVLACAEHGASIFMEKPICRNLEEADEMVRACERHHVKLALAHQTRYSPVMAHIREVIERGQIGDILELRGRGKEDRRVGGEDMLVLGSHIVDLMRLFAGDCRSCFARVEVHEKNRVRPIARQDVRQGNEGIGPLAGNSITAMYTFDHGIRGYFASQFAQRNAGNQSRFGLTIQGSRGVIQLTTGSVPAAYLLPDPTWFPGNSNVRWQRITSAGVGKPETIKDASLTQGNVWIVQDLMEAIERDRQPKCSVYDGRAGLEMLLATYESQRLGRPVETPLQNRRHPLAVL